MKSVSRHKGVLYILLSALFFSCMSACVRLSGDLPTIQKTFFRNLVSLFIAFSVLLKNRAGFRISHRNNTLPLLGRVIFGTLGMLASFYAVDHLSLSDATMLGKLAPFFAVIASRFILKEQITPLQAATLAGACAGAMFIVRPSFENLTLIPGLIGLAGGLFAGIAYTLVRFLGQRGERSSYIVFAFSAFSCLIALPFMVFGYQSMSVRQTLYLLGAGCFAAAGQFSVTAAYTNAPAREISIFDYSEVLFSAILGFLVFGDRPDGLSCIGYFMISCMAALNFMISQKKMSSSDPLSQA